MSTSYDVSIVVGYTGSELLKKYIDDDLYDMIEENDLVFADTRGRGEYDDGVIGVQIVSDGYMNIDLILETHKIRIEKAKQKIKKVFDMDVEPSAYASVSVC